MIPTTDIVSKETPAGWRNVPFWSLFRRQKKTGFPDEELLSVYRDYGVIPKSSRDDNHNKESEDLSGYQLVTKGALVTNKMKAWQGSIAISRYRGIVSPAYYVYTPLSDECDQFLHYLLRSDPYIGLYGRISKGVRVNQWDLEHEALRNIPVLLPDLATQRQIADFLDRETARIDLLIEKKQKLVTLLKAQRAAAISSGVTVGLNEDPQLVATSSQHLPSVPKTWRVWRLKHLGEIRGGLTLGRKIPDNLETTPTPYMRVANVQAGRLNLSDVAEIPVTEDEKKRYRLQHGDVLMNEGGDNDKLGRGAVWKSEIDNCVHQNHVFAFRPYDTRFSEWISLATNALYARDFFYLHSNQSTNLASISKTNLSRLPIALPPIDEMQATLGALWDRVEKLDSITERTLLSIDRLKEYRSALITAAVTGQIDVSTYAKSGIPDRRIDAIQEEMDA